MIHHVVLEVSDRRRSVAFYDAVLAPLGWRRHFDEPHAVGWGVDKPIFFVTATNGSAHGNGHRPVHLCFSALGAAAVKAAWEGGVRVGGRNAGDPGARPSHGSGTYSAFLADPDGHSLEITIATE